MTIFFTKYLVNEIPNSQSIEVVFKYQNEHTGIWYFI